MCSGVVDSQGVNDEVNIRIESISFINASTGITVDDVMDVSWPICGWSAPSADTGNEDMISPAV